MTDNPFSGWWMTITKGSGNGYILDNAPSDADSYIFIDTTHAPIIIATTFGTILHPFETPASFKENHTNRFRQIDEWTLISEENQYGFSGEDYKKYPASFATLTLQDDGALINTSSSNPAAYIQVTATRLVRCDEPKLLTGNINDPVFLLKYVFGQMLYMGNPQQVVDSDFIGFEKAHKILQKLLDPGITITTRIKKIMLTALDSGLTDIFTDEFSYVTPGSRVSLRGFTGPYSNLNKDYINGASTRQYGGTPNPSALHVNLETYPFHFLLRYDTSKLPRDEFGYGYPEYFENATVTVTHHVTSSTEYCEFVAAVFALFYLVWQVSQHTAFDGYGPNKFALYHTWEELREALASDTADKIALGTRTATMRPSCFYTNPVFNERLGNAFLVNDPFGIRPDAAGEWPEIYDYDIVLENYLVDVCNLYWAMDGKPYGQWKDVHLAVRSLAPYKRNVDANINGASTFVGKVASYFPRETLNADPEVYTLFGGSLDEDLDTKTILRDKNTLYFGRIRPDLTNNRNIGYIRFRDFAACEPEDFTLNAFYNPFPDSPKPNREAMSKVLSVMLKYLVTDLSVEAIIIDIRNNGGGAAETGQALAEFFGSDRPGLVGHTVYKDPSNQNVDRLQDEQYITAGDAFSETQKQYAALYVDINERYYPGSVFRNGVVVLLTDCMSASAGDTFPHFLLGPTLDKNIGAQTFVYFVGDIDGRIKGFASKPSFLPFSEKSLLRNDKGEPVSSLRIRYDAGLGFHPMSVGSYFLCQQVPYTAMDPAPLPNDFESLLWSDLGFIRPYPHEQLKNEPKPDPNNQRSWNDTWLRHAILTCLTCSKCTDKR